MSNFSSKWKRRLQNMVGNVEENYDAFKYKLKKYENIKHPLQLNCYLGFGNSKNFFVQGRLLEDKEIKQSSRKDSTWRNMVNMYKRFGTDELPDVGLTISGEGFEVDVKTDEEGFFQAQIPTPVSFLENNLWNEVEVKLTDKRFKKLKELKNTAKILIPASSAKYGIISDIDDTIMITRADSVFRMVSLTILNNAYTRHAFRGVTSFYRALKNTGKGGNPFFYVSSSPWNLFDFIKDFFQYNRLPIGPFMLRDYGIDESKFQQDGHHSHKMYQISRILDTYPELPFILIGDSGQHDPEIFTDVVKKYPNRILTVYIRDIVGEKRYASIKKLAKKMEKNGVDLVLFHRTKEAALHAIRKGYINSSTYLEII